MLPKNRRIRRKSFPEILTQGKRWNSPHLLMYASKTNSRTSSEAPVSESQFSFSVSKKVASKASDRNKYRRRGYSVVKNHLDKIKPGFAFLFSFKKGAVPLKFAELEKEILELLSTAGVLK